MKFTKTEIDQFIRGHLPKEKYDMFIKAIQSDSELAKEVEFYKKISSSSKKIGREELRAELESIHKNKVQNGNEGSSKTFKKIWPWILAAAILISILAYWTIKNNQVSNPTKELYATYYKPYEFNAGTRTNVEQIELLQLDELYALQKYEQVIPLMEKYLSNDSDNNNVRLALANAYLETEKNDQALTTLNDLESKNDVFLSGHVLWYKALCLLKLKDYKSCMTILEQISSNPGSDHYQEALKLMEEIKVLL